MKICLSILAVMVIAAAMCVAGPGGPTGQAAGICGNNACDSGENCWNCGADCACKDGQYCSSKENACVNTACGNGVCEPFEDSSNCCLDCKCHSIGQMCSQATKSCEAQDFSVSDDEAKEIAMAYFNNTGNAADIIGFGTYYGKLVKVVRVETSDGGTEYVGVSEDEMAVILPVL